MNVTCIATRYGPGIESRWGEICRTRPEWHCDRPNHLYNGFRVFPVDKTAILFYLYYYIFRISDQVTSNDELEEVSNGRSWSNCDVVPRYLPVDTEEYHAEVLVWVASAPAQIWTGYYVLSLLAQFHSWNNSMDWTMNHPVQLNLITVRLQKTYVYSAVNDPYLRLKSEKNRKLSLYIYIYIYIYIYLLLLYHQSYYRL